MFKTKTTKNIFENLRVFTISLNGSLIEWNINTLCPKVNIFFKNFFFRIIFPTLQVDSGIST